MFTYVFLSQRIMIANAKARSLRDRLYKETVLNKFKIEVKNCEKPHKQKISYLQAFIQCTSGVWVIPTKSVIG